MAGPQRALSQRRDVGARHGGAGAARSRPHERDGGVAALHAGPARRPRLHAAPPAALRLHRVSRRRPRRPHPRDGSNDI